MKLMGLEEKVRERVVDEKGLVLVNRKGKRKVVFGKEKSAAQTEEGKKKNQKMQGFSAEWYVNFQA